MKKEKRNLEIKKDYESGISMTELVKKYGLHRSTLQKILKFFGVKLHKNKSLIKCNRKFFSKYTKESCYWAGFILADGNIRKDRNSLQIKLSKIDKGHLVKFLNSISCKDLNRVKEYENYVSLTISLDEFKCDLNNNFDITPQKTYTAFVSNKIPNKYINHFIRGYIDGDGSITKTSVGTLSLVGTVNVLEFISNYFKDNFDVVLKSKNDTPPITNLKNGIGSISYSGKNAKKILDNLYSNINDNIILERKYKKYNELF